MRYLLLLLMFVVLLAASAAAQEVPSVDIVLSEQTAQQGDTVTADVYVRNATAVGGTDIGITVDENCLRIIERQPGDYLPSGEGAFSAFSEINDHDTRLALALTDRSKIPSGDGIFYSVELEVTCEQGVAPLNVTYAKISTYEDPNAEVISLISYALDEGTLTANGAELTVGAGSQAATEPPAEATAGPTAAVDETVTATPTPTVEPEDENAAEDEDEVDRTLVIIVVIVLIVAILLLSILALWLWRRSRQRSNRSG